MDAYCEVFRIVNLSIYDALNQPLCDLTHQMTLSACQRVDFNAILRDSIPAIGTMLNPPLEGHPIDLEGRIRELDKNHLSFELREIGGTPLPQ
jgi:hypothetical protein